MNVKYYLFSFELLITGCGEYHGALPRYLFRTKELISPASRSVGCGRLTAAILSDHCPWSKRVASLKAVSLPQGRSASNDGAVQKYKGPGPRPQFWTTVKGHLSIRPACRIRCYNCITTHLFPLLNPAPTLPPSQVLFPTVYPPQSTSRMQISLLESVSQEPHLTHS